MNSILFYFLDGAKSQLNWGSTAQDNWQQLLCDGLHLSADGAALVGRSVMPVLQERLATYRPRNLKIDDNVLPLWRDVPNADPEASLKKWLKDHPTEWRLDHNTN